MGIIHKNLSLADQINEVDKVKRREKGITTVSITLPTDETIGKERRCERKVSVRISN